MQTYVNGVRVDDFNFAQGSLNGVDRIFIGKHNDNTSEGTRRFFKGSIDEVSIYSVKLTADSVTALYNADSAGKCFVSPPANDDIQNAQTLTGTGGVALGTNVGATRQTGNFLPEVSEPVSYTHLTLPTTPYV